MSARVYERKFDWEEAAELYAAGASGLELAERYSVTHGAIYAAFKKLGVETRDPAPVTTVRPDTLRCFDCREWKPDSEFARSADRYCRARRGRHGQCRVCNTRSRTAYRHRHKQAENAYSLERRKRLGRVLAVDCDEHDRCRGCGTGRHNPAGANRYHRASCPLRAELRRVPA